jgi:hypothetical protein
MKESEENPIIMKFSKKKKDQPYHQEEFSDQTYNQKAPSFLTPRSESIRSTLQ